MTKDVSYALGLGIGHQLAQMDAKDLSVEDFAAAIEDVLQGKELRMSNRDAQRIVEDFFKKKENERQAEQAAKGKVAREAGEKYLEQNAKQEGVIMKVSWWMALFLTAVSSVANLHLSPLTKLSLVGQRVYNLCKRVPNIVSSSPGV